MIGEKIVEEARTWLGTPWKHQGRLKGIGVDCIGLVQKSYEAATGKLVDNVPNYHRMPVAGRENRIIESLDIYGVEVDKSDMQVGDIILFRFLNGASNHVGIYTGNNCFIHSWMDVNKVVEMPLSNVWSRSIKTVFRIPEEEA